MSLSLDIIKQLPKADLHCHLDGFCRPETIIELAHEQNVTLPTEDINELKKILTAPFDCPDLPTYLKCFDAPLDVMQYPYAITRIFYEACEDAVKDGITYLELRFAPALHTRNGHSYSQILQAAIDGASMAEMKLPITVRIICCAMRHMSPEINKQVADVCWRYRHNGVVAFDLAGPEYGFPPDKHIAAFRTMREKNVGLTIHAGEAFGAKSVELALACNANRIGHGTRIAEDPNVLNQIIDRRIPLEMCVTSNCQTKAIEKLEDHPIKQYFDMGAITVPCTDNPTVSGCTLSGEYFLIQNKFGFNVEELVRMMDYGFRSAFVEEGLKKRLRIEAITKTLKILRENNIDVSPIVNQKMYWSSIGLDLSNGFIPPQKQPEVTLDIIRSLQKADGLCRFIGSVPLKVLYKFFEEIPQENRIKNFDSFEAFENFFLHPESDWQSKKAKEIAASLLQTEAHIRAAVNAILKEALQDRVKYIEISYMPQRHTSGGLTEKQALDAIVDEVESFTSVNKIIAKVIISIAPDVDTPLVAQKLAELCVEYKNKCVAGFSTEAKELTRKTIQYFQPVFDYLRRNFISVSMFAGEENEESIPIAIVRGNARKISGAYQVAESCSLLKNVTSNGLSVLCAPTERMSSSVASCFARNPVRSFIDFGVKVSFCSIDNALTGKTRSEQLYQLVNSSGFSILDIIKITINAFGSAFLPYKEIKALQKEYVENSVKYLKECGFGDIIDHSYFVQ